MSIIDAFNQCTEKEDIKPDKVLRPIGTTFKEWAECSTTTDLPHWINWKVVGHMESIVGRRGNTLLYERNEEIESFEPIED